MSFLEVKDLVVVNSQGQKLLKGVSLEIQKSGVTALIGESGAGKSLLCRAVTSLLPKGVSYVGGRFFYEGREYGFKELRKLRGAEILYIPPFGAASFNPIKKIGKQVREGNGLSYAGAVGLLEEFDFPDPEGILNSYPFQLSGGEAQRCLLAVAAAMRPRLLILDEPTASLDIECRDSFLNVLKKMKGNYSPTILWVTHDLDLACHFSDFLSIILEGEIVESGSVQEVMACPLHSYTREIVEFISR